MKHPLLRGVVAVPCALPPPPTLTPNPKPRLRMLQLCLAGHSEEHLLQRSHAQLHIRHTQRRAGLRGRRAAAAQV